METPEVDEAAAHVIRGESEAGCQPLLDTGTHVYGGRNGMRGIKDAFALLHNLDSCELRIGAVTELCCEVRANAGNQGQQVLTCKRGRGAHETQSRNGSVEDDAAVTRGPQRT